jgi:hypothetical protein
MRNLEIVPVATCCCDIFSVLLKAPAHVEQGKIAFKSYEINPTFEPTLRGANTSLSSQYQSPTTFKKLFYKCLFLCFSEKPSNFTSFL